MGGGETLAAAGVDIDGGRIELLCMPRVLGHVFNPLSLFFCHRPDGALAAMIYEVNNTFGERHAYVIPVEGQEGAGVRQTCAKAFHVSPFLPMNMRYDFTVRRSARGLCVIVDGTAAGGRPMIHTRFTGASRPFTDRTLAGLLVTHPLLTLKVVAGIHLEALKLMIKGLRLLPRPPSPATPVTVGRPASLATDGHFP